MDAGALSWSDEREWLCTNGLGGYAFSPLCGINRRRYHGLLVAAFSPEDRRVLVSKIDEELAAGSGEYRLYANQYWDEKPPEQPFYLKGFSYSPLPELAYVIPGIGTVRKTVFMPHGENCTLVKYEIAAKRGARFNANVLATSRDHNWVLREPGWSFACEKEGELLTLTPGHPDPPTICMGSTLGSVSAGPAGLVRGLFYGKEKERGYDCLEGVFSAGHIEAEIGKKRRRTEFYVAMAADMSREKALWMCEDALASAKALEKREIRRKKGLADRFYKISGLKRSAAVTRLAHASDDFLASRGGRAGIIAGYPWFGEWGRDSLISLPGLCLATGRKLDSECVLAGLVADAEGCRIPNCFTGGKNLNSADASLWLFWAVEKHLKQGGADFVRRRLWEFMKAAVDAYMGAVDSDGLLDIESARPQTWMDAVVDGDAVTPRSGKAVEMQALWFNALKVFSSLAVDFYEDTLAESAEKAADACKKGFNEKFWNEKRGYLYDCISGGTDDVSAAGRRAERKDASIRPNALLAISMPFPILDSGKYNGVERGKWKSVVDVAKLELLTPFGLRSLAPSEPGYKGSAHGNQRERDLAYHQGSVWPWLFGPFCDAHRRAYPEKGVSKFIEPLVERHLTASGIGVSEVFDGDSPHLAEGCPTQAWSVAELLRVIS